MRGAVVFWTAIARLVDLVLDLLAMRRRAESAKDLAIVLLRRRQARPQFSRCERLTLTLPATKLRHRTHDALRLLSQSLVLVTPEAVLRWHRGLVRR
jgi:hypothetical protein